MDKEINNSTFQYPLTIEELIDDMEKHPDRYKHLQFILNRKKTIIWDWDRNIWWLTVLALACMSLMALITATEL